MALPGDIRAPWSRSSRPVARRVVRPVQQFLHEEVASGISLLVATIAALLWANLDPDGYRDFWATPITVGLGSWGHTEPLSAVINDGLMALFFFVIGLEVKREITVGELADRRAALLPLSAAVGGMVVPAAVFIALTAGSGAAEDGWGIPMATDIAFALGVAALLGSRVPVALKVFLLGIAVIDDIGAIIVIAVAYSGGVAWWWLAAAVAQIALLVLLRRIHVRAMLPYIILGLGIWLATFESGLHATIAGVVLGLLTPVRPFQRGDEVSATARRIADITSDEHRTPEQDRGPWQMLSWLSREAVSPSARLESALHPWTAGVVLPLFALANVGVVIDADALDTLAEPVAVGVLLGLLIGKPVGVAAGAWIAVKTGVARLPNGITWAHVIGVGWLAGIGFTMSLFVTTLAYSRATLVEQSTFAVLVASVVAGGIGAAILARAGR